MIEVLTRVDLGAWQLLVDIPATRRRQAAEGAGSARRCGCPSCRNYLAARPRFADSGVPEVFASLGIDWKKEAHVAHGTCLRDGEIPYAGFFRLVGEIQRGGDLFVRETVMGFQTCVPRQELLVRLPPTDFRFGFSSSTGVDDAGQVALHFRVTLPWVLQGVGFAACVQSHAPGLAV